jgi:hypothetical protein
MNQVRDNNFNIFNNQYNLLFKMITFLTTPEHTFNNSRCLISCPLTGSCPSKIKQIYEEKNKLHDKETELSENCNMINLVLLILINEIEEEYIDNLIQYLNLIDLDYLFYNQYNFNKLNNEISEFVSLQQYNNNIINNYLNNQLIIEYLVEKISNFLITDGIFGPMKFRLTK